MTGVSEGRGGDYEDDLSLSRQSSVHSRASSVDSFTGGSLYGSAFSSPYVLSSPPLAAQPSRTSSRATLHAIQDNEAVGDTQAARRHNPPPRHSSLDMGQSQLKRRSVEVKQVYQLMDPTQSTILEEKEAGPAGSETDSRASQRYALDRKRRRRKWWIFGVVLAILVILGAVLGGVLGSRRSASSSETTAAAAAQSQSAGQSPSTTLSPLSSTVAAAPATTTASDTGRYNAFVSFGASYCDNGHNRSAQYALSLTSPPYWDGRWSNGPVWTEYLSMLIGPNPGTNATLMDYSYAGAMVQNNVTGAAVPDTLSQIQSFLSDAAGGNKTVQKAISQRTLWAIWVGINPLVDIWLQAGVYYPLTNSSTAYAANMTSRNLAALQIQLQMLLNNQISGDLLLLTLPPVNTLPEVNRRSPSKAVTSLMANLSMQYNAGLEQIAQALGPRVFLYNATQVWQNWESSPSTYSLTDVTDACTDMHCNNPQSYLYWDEIHPTTTRHQAFANLLVPFLANATSTS